MKKLILTISAILIAIAANAQIPETINFETVGTDSLWYIFSNGTDNPKYCAVVDNPDKSGLNTTQKVGKLDVVANGSPWAGMYSTTAIKPFKWSENNCIIKILVYKDVISDFDLKFETAINTEWAHEVKVANTVTNQWEELSFDFSQYVGDTNTISRIVIIPDFPATRTAGSTNYFDHIIFGSASNTSVISQSTSNTRISPNPVNKLLYVNGKPGAIVNIYSITGALVLSKTNKSASIGIDVSMLNSGIYVVKSDNITEKIIIR